MNQMNENLKYEELVSAALLLENNITWQDTESPSKTDVLFKGEDQYWQLNACLNFDPNGLGYSIGYLHAARHLTQLVCLTGRNMDSLIYPIVFLYRHYIELMFKELIVKCMDVLRHTPDAQTERVLGKHDFSIIWPYLKPLFANVFAQEPDIKGTIEAIDSYTAQITNIDPQSFAFRYHKDKKRQVKNLDQVNHINIYTFHTNIEKLVTILEGCEALLDHWDRQTW